MSTVARGDDSRYFGRGGRVRAARLFPLPSSYTPGLTVLEGGPDLDALYDELAELLARPDALDSGSETAARIAEVEARLEAFEQREADELRAAFEDSLLMPLGAGAELAKEVADALAGHGNPAADESAAR
jgi:hypothetical protein